MSEATLSPDFVARLKAVRLVVFDVDGTLTDGTIILGAEGEYKPFNIKDGLGIRLLMDAGIRVAFITGRSSPATERRARELDVQHCIVSERDKGGCVTKLISDMRLAPPQAAAMGDDLPDLPLISACGVRLAVADAAAEVLAEADWVSTSPGGHGAAREAAELILKAQGLWSSLLETLDSVQDRQT